MDKQTKFMGYRIEESVFRLRASKENEKFSIAPRYSCTIKGNAERFSASLTAQVGEGVSDAPAPFDIKATITGNFIIGEDVASSRDAQLKTAVTVLFPYLRAFVSTLTSVSGVPPFILPFISGDAMIKGAQNEARIDYN